MFNKFKKKMVERSNKRILEYVLNTPDVWLEVLRIINNRYEGNIFSRIEIKDNKFNKLTLEQSVILGGVNISGNNYIPNNDNLQDIDPFIEFNNSIIKRKD